MNCAVDSLGDWLLSLRVMFLRFIRAVASPGFVSLNFGLPRATVCLCWGGYLARFLFVGFFVCEQSLSFF